MTDKSNHPFQEGQEVAVLNYGGFGLPHPQRGKVGKVRKDGRFLLNGSDEQWTAAKSYTGGWEASNKGRRFSCEVWAPKHDQMLADIARHQRWRIALDRFKDVARHTPNNEAHIAALEILTAELKGNGA